MNDDELMRTASRQHGLVTRDQAIAAGLTRRMIQHRVRTGRWHQLRRGVFGIAGVVPTWEQAVMAGVLAAGETAAASHATAARLWGLPCPSVDAIEVTTILLRVVRLDGVVAHRSGIIPEADRTTIRGISVTSGARTVVDLSGRLDIDALRHLVDDGLRTGAMSLSGLNHCLSNLERFAAGRSPRKMHAVLAKLVPGYEPGDSYLETQIYEWIFEAGLPAPVRLHRVQIGNRSLTIDMAYPKWKVAIEVDGYDFHRGRHAFDTDRLRGNALVADGWTILRFTSTSTRQEVVDAVGPFVRGGTHSVPPRTNTRRIA